jgi:hypothetical protein
LSAQGKEEQEMNTTNWYNPKGMCKPYTTQPLLIIKKLNLYSFSENDNTYVGNGATP